MSNKVRIAILSCLEATAVCSGAACFRALNDRDVFFSDYKDKTVEVLAFFHCNGCACDYDTDLAYLDKIERVCAMQPDAVHVGKCTAVNGTECSCITKIIDYIEGQGITVIRGTH
ncbi:MAG: CGGC domain-containing protein [Clostridia bacterium]|nr:CGGC domain-containing protein [Clostridia bacterium]